MANWLTCKLTGRHEYTVWCENGAMFLRCTCCGRRSQGWTVADKAPTEAGEPVAQARSTTPLTRLSIVRPD